MNTAAPAVKAHLFSAEALEEARAQPGLCCAPDALDALDQGPACVEAEREVIAEVPGCGGSASAVTRVVQEAVHR